MGSMRLPRVLIGSNSLSSCDLTQLSAATGSNSLPFCGGNPQHLGIRCLWQFLFWKLYLAGSAKWKLSLAASSLVLAPFAREVFSDSDRPGLSAILTPG